MDIENRTIKRDSLTKTIREAARKAAVEYYECNSKEVDEENMLPDGRINPNWLDEGYCDQISEVLYGDSQADDIIADDKMFSNSEYEGPLGRDNRWSLLEKYFDNDEIEDIFCEEWHKLLAEKYGEKWRILS